MYWQRNLRKSFSSIAIIIMTGSVCIAATKTVAEAPKQKTVEIFETKSKYKLENSFGWQIEVPAGWMITPVGGDDVLTNPIVQISLVKGVIEGKNPDEIPLNAMGGTIYVNQKRNKPTVVGRIGIDPKSKKGEAEAVETKLKFNKNEYSGTVSYTVWDSKTPIEPKGIQWEVFGSCNNLDLKILIGITRPPNEMKKPLNEQKIPPSLQAVFDTLECE